MIASLRRPFPRCFALLVPLFVVSFAGLILALRLLRFHSLKALPDITLPRPLNMTGVGPSRRAGSEEEDGVQISKRLACGRSLLCRLQNETKTEDYVIFAESLRGPERVESSPSPLSPLEINPADLFLSR